MALLLRNHWHGQTEIANQWLKNVASECQEVVFAWGAFKVVKDLGRDKEMALMFPKAKCLGILKNGEPRHPLYCKSKTELIIWRKDA